MAKREYRWAFQLDGRDVVVTVEWSSFWATGRVRLNDREISRWGLQHDFQHHGFKHRGHHWEVRRTDAGNWTTPLRSLELWVDGRPAEGLGAPRAMAQLEVVNSQPQPCPVCHAPAVLLIYNTGKPEFVCGQCGRRAID